VAVRSPESADALGVDATPVCVLLVEDNEDVAAATASMLRELGCHTIEARDGASALEILEREPAIELVMSDIVMPGAMNGLDLARFLRERRPDLSVVLATAYSQYGREVASEGFPMLEKPYRLDRLARVIETAIAAKRQHHRAL
jgi:CheY-like chemotaxis protein